jgi:hypothetical protein
VTEEPAGGIARIIFKMRHEGPAWVARRVSAETVNPTTHPGRLLHALARRGISAAGALPRLMRRLRVPTFANSDTLLYAFYDLEVAPITFDFLWFLAAADLHRRHRSLKDIHVIIVPGRYEGLRHERADYEPAVSSSARHERVQSILFEACRLLPSCAGITHAATRAETQSLRSSVHHIFPSDYDASLPTFPTSRVCLDAARRGERPIAVLRATPERRSNVERWLAARGIGSRRLITITLRGYSYMPQRNSNLAAWSQFARSLDPARFFVVFVPDTDETIEGLPSLMNGLITFPEAAWNIGLRMALYERACLNMGVNTGPMGLCWLNESTHYVTIKMAPEGVPQTTLEFFRSLGFEPGQSLPFATPRQELVWQDDTFEEIQAAFARMTQCIESGAAR